MAMPELPEVEVLRRSLVATLSGRFVCRVRVRRADVVQGLEVTNTSALLRGRQIDQVERHGKQLALITAPLSPASTDRPCLCIHLGMSGSLRVLFPPDGRGKLGCHSPPLPKNHCHVIWYLDNRAKLVFHDPRRFGGIWVFAHPKEMWLRRWQYLGPDALSITPDQLHHRLQHTSRSIKAALLDQNLIAGLGNIYVDELLYACRLHPMAVARTLGKKDADTIVRRARRLLLQAVSAGGSTLRDYQDSDGSRGRFQNQHQVYRRAHQPCKRCRRPLITMKVAGRTTVYCARCQNHY